MTTKKTPEEPQPEETAAAPEQQKAGEEPTTPETRVGLEAWLGDNHFRPDHQGEPRDERVTGMLGAFAYTMREAGKFSALPSEYEDEWANFITRVM